MNRILCHRREIESKNIHRKTYARREGQTWNTRVCPTNECLITTGTANHQEMTFDASVRRETVPSRITPNLEQKEKINPLKSRNYDKKSLHHQMSPWLSFDFFETGYDFVETGLDFVEIDVEMTWIYFGVLHVAWTLWKLAWTLWKSMWK